MPENKINIEKHIRNFSFLSKIIDDYLESNLQENDNNKKLIDYAINQSIIHNSFFTETTIRFALKSISDSLIPDKLYKWISAYSFQENSAISIRTVGVVMAGNIPLVGFHDFLCVIISGNKFFGKLSHSDSFMLPAIAEILIDIDSDYSSKIEFTTEKLERFHAVIATGSNNTSRYFEYYFSKYLNIIRKNRTSLGVISGNETLEQLTHLADDIFMYFGLGCRNVTKLFVPQNYDFSQFIRACNGYSPICDHNKYKNNYDYYKTIFIMNNQPFIDSGFFLLHEDISIHPPVSIINYEYYTNKQSVIDFINSQAENIQCIVSDNFEIKNRICFGSAQKPQLWDYSDNTDTMNFLLNLK